VAKKKGHEEEHENHERWLVSYADFITLLFAFFVVMYSVSKVDNKRLVQTANAIKFALHFEGTGGITALPLFEGPPSEGGCVINVSTGARLSSQEKKAIELMRARLEKKLRSYLLEQPAAAIMVQSEGRRLMIRLSATHFFDPSQAALRPEALPILDAIAAELTTLGRPIRVEGHTDNRTAKGTRYRDNWDLSAARAATVVSYLEQAHPIRSEFLSAVGVGGTRPMASNETPEGRETNRRVELVVELNPGDSLSMAAR
jgi:chemotaxis protein MotB